MSEIIDTSHPYNLRQMDLSPTPIQQFYAGSSVFITGGTGFLGRSMCIAEYKNNQTLLYIMVKLITVLINKLLTSCPNIKNIYLLVRKKKGKDVQERIDDIFNESVSKVPRR